MANRLHCDIFTFMEISNAVEALSALAQYARLDIYRLLVQQGPEGMPAGAVSARLEIPPATLSFHLTTLRHAGLVSKRREGRQILYSACYDTISELMRFLMHNCCQGHPEACAFLENIPPEAACVPQTESTE